uniref:Uncharacterized protein n=1 Tax=Meloidogyne incognita TaxID=6306 RepID=A0A914NCF4_MELIC
MKEQTNEQEFAPLSKQNCLPVYEPSTSQTLEVLQSSNSSLPINNRNSLYHSLPLYWPKGWRTYGPSTQTNSFHQSSLNPEPSFTASTSPLIDNEQETNTRQQRKIFSLNRHQKISNNDTTSKGWRRKRRKEFNFVGFLNFLITIESLYNELEGLKENFGSVKKRIILSGTWDNRDFHSFPAVMSKE